MPINQRIRDNNVFGTVADNPLLAGATTFNSSGLVNLSAVIAKHAIITLDPLRQYGSPEIIIVTTHNVSATTATISRGAYGTIPRQHPQGTLWVHAPTNEDFIQILSSSTRPLDPYRGELIFEYDTDKFVARSITDVWQDVMPLGAWISWTPVLVGLTGGTLNFARYSRHGRTIFYRFKYTLAGAGFASNPSFTLPVAANAEYAGQDLPIGHAAFADVAVATYPGVVTLSTTTIAQFQVYNAAGTYAVGNAPTATIPHTWAVNDFVYAWGTYEAVS